MAAPYPLPTLGEDWEFGTPISGISLYDWNWLARRFDANQGQRVDEQEFGGPREFFTVLDCDWDGTVTRQDFDWSAQSRLGLQHEAMFAFFQTMDRNSDGLLTGEEWKLAFPAENQAGMNERQLEQLVYGPLRQRWTANKRMTRTQLESEYDFGKPAPVPRTMAPDFELKTPD